MPLNVNCDFTGLVHARKYRIMDEKDDGNNQQTLSDYDNVDHYLEPETKLRSSADIVSLNRSMTSSVPREQCTATFTGEQLNQHDEQRRAHRGDDDDYIIVDQERALDQLTMITNERDFSLQEEYDNDDEHMESTRLFDHGEHDGMLSDQSASSDDLR
jgi:hypothetical protein